MLSNKIFSCFWIALVFLLDGLSKYAAVKCLTPDVPLHLFPGLQLTLAQNQGVAFSLLNGGGWQSLLVILIAVGLIDFIDVYAGAYHWPTFNLADSMIVIGVVCLLWAWRKPQHA